MVSLLPAKDDHAISDQPWAVSVGKVVQLVVTALSVGSLHPHAQLIEKFDLVSSDINPKRLRAHLPGH